ncbi:MAG: hypothetical protein Q8O67_14970 [Deltaproteobacteria bacterium]|nr:hypothetical protein [Deltaproteobacteria bacterium]
MLRRASVLVVVVAAAAACSPNYDVTVGWTLDGDDPAPICAFLPKGSVVRLSATSRDTSDERNSAPRETTSDVACDAGTGSIQTGNFAEVRAELVAGDDVFGTSGLISINPGAPGSGYQVEEEAAVVDIRLVRGTLTANLTVVGQDCETAGASTFTVSLFQNAEPLSNVLVIKDVAVACSDGAAVFTHSPVDIDSTYVIKAVTTVGAESFSTPAGGEGVLTEGANTVTTVDLVAAE